MLGRTGWEKVELDAKLVMRADGERIWLPGDERSYALCSGKGRGQTDGFCRCGQRNDEPRLGRRVWQLSDLAGMTAKLCSGQGRRRLAILPA